MKESEAQPRDFPECREDGDGRDVSGIRLLARTRGFMRALGGKKTLCNQGAALAGNFKAWKPGRKDGEDVLLMDSQWRVAEVEAGQNTLDSRRKRLRDRQTRASDEAAL